MVTKDIERTYIIPLRREFLKVPKYKRAKKAITAIKEFLVKHTKTTEIKLGKQLNQAVWVRGIKSPPHHIKINVKVVEGVAQAELFGFEFSEKKMEKKEEKSGTLKDKLTEKLTGKEKKVNVEDKKSSTVKEEKSSETKKAVEEKSSSTIVKEKVVEKTETKKAVEKPVTEKPKTNKKE